MKRILKVFAVLLSLLMMISSSMIAGSAITVKKDGKEYFLRSHTPTKGDCKVLLIRLGFADHPLDDENDPADSEETLLSYFDGSKGSVNEFYETSSYGRLKLSCDKVYSYTAEYNRGDYEGRLFDFEALIREALNALEDEINYGDYDSDGDGYIDFLCFDFSGPMGNWGETWWPQVLKAEEISAGDKKVDLYSVIRGKSDVYIHEFGHILGAADYYTTDGNQYDAIMTYDIMCKRDGDHNGFTKWSYGWLDDNNISFVDKSSGDTTVELVPIESTGDGKKIAVVAPELNGSFLDEYFLVEYDSGNGNNSGVFEDNDLTVGFRIFHVNAGSNFEEIGGTIDYEKSNFLLRNNLIHNMKNEYGDPYSWVGTKDNMFYREGDVLSYDTTPNTGFSQGAAYNGLFTGISFTDFVTGENPSFKVSFTDDYSGDAQPVLTLSYEKLKANMEMTLSSDIPLTTAFFEDFESFNNHQPYLLDKDGNKLNVTVTASADDPLVYECSYTAGYPPVIPNSEYTLVIPEGYFLASYSTPVAEFRQRVKSDAFIALTTISETTPDNSKLSSNIFAVTDKTYGIISASNKNGGVCTFTEYNLNGEELSSVDFKAPDFKLPKDAKFFSCSAFKLNDGNYALELSSYDNFYFVKFDRNGKILSDVFSFNMDLISAYNYSFFAPEDLDLYKDGLCKHIMADDYKNAAFLKIDFKNGVTVEPAEADLYYYSIDSETYAIEKYYDHAAHLLIYDRSDKQIGDISLDASFLGAFEEDGNIKVIYNVFKQDMENEDNSIELNYVDTYTKDGRLIESKEITDNAKHIGDYGVFRRCHASGSGYFFTSLDPDCETVAVYDKDWNYIDELSFNLQTYLCFVGNCGLIKDNNSMDAQYISRFNIGEVEIVPKPEKVKLSEVKISGLKNKTYTGKTLKQNITLTCNGKKLAEGTDYTVSYSNNKNVGTASVTIKGKGNYTGTIKKSFTIKKAANPITVTTKTIKAYSKKNTTVAKTKAFVIKNAKGSVIFKRISGNKKITISKSGKISVKKGLKKGKTYSVKIKVSAAGTNNFKKASKTVTVKVKDK